MAITTAIPASASAGHAILCQCRQELRAQRLLALNGQELSRMLWDLSPTQRVGSLFAVWC